MEFKNFEFEKFHGLGNDYIIVNNLKWEIPDEKKSDLASRLCEQHFSVGADGLIYVCSPKSADIKMRIFNNDGSEAEMCGNGIRCFSKFVYENDIVKKKNISIETLKGLQDAKLEIKDGLVESVEINMGEPILDCDKIPVDAGEGRDQCINESIVILDEIFRFSSVSMGNPHAVVFLDKRVDDRFLYKYGAAFESNKIFPERINVEFVKVISKKEAILRVFERGVGITNSCGTGSCAAVVAGVVLGLFEQGAQVLVHNDGGDLKIMYDGKEVHMEGPIERVFRGTIEHLKL